MEKFVVEKSECLHGTVKISGAKNAALPIMAACILAEGDSTIHNIPSLSDISIMKEILEYFGAQIIWNPVKSSMTIRTKNIRQAEVPYEIVSKIRASFLVMAPMLARFGKCTLNMPGGCNIGQRPIDLHLKGFSALGADIEINHGKVHARSNYLRGDKIYLDFPSVGATENIIMAAVLADGITTVENAATEPEVVDLANFLNSMGANIRGAGTNTVKITGVSKLNGADYTIIPDRIEAGTLMIAVSACGGDVLLSGITGDHLKPVVAKLREMNVETEESPGGFRIISGGYKALLPTEIKTMPHPGFPTDLQAQMSSLLALCKGNSLITETIFENRFMYVPELAKMGANIKIVSQTAFIEGVDKLTSAKLSATDLRAGAALTIAALCAEGMSEIDNIYHIDRGYYALEEKLRTIGAKILRCPYNEKLNISPYNSEDNTLHVSQVGYN